MKGSAGDTGEGGRIYIQREVTQTMEQFHQENARSIEYSKRNVGCRTAKPRFPSYQIFSIALTLLSVSVSFFFLFLFGELQRIIGGLTSGLSLFNFGDFSSV